MQKEQIGLIGLGLMGSALAERLLGASYSVLGYDVDASRCEALAKTGGAVASGAAEVAESCNRIVLSLPTSQIVDAVVEQMNPALRSGQIIVDTTTGEPLESASLGSRLDKAGVHYLDAPVSGSSAQLRKADVIVVAGGRREDFDACEDLFRCFARRWFHVGSWGGGARMKLVGNLVLGLNRAALAEGLAFARALDLDPEIALTIFKESMAHSRIMDTKGEKMILGDFEPQARLSQHLKDVRLILQAAGRAGLDLPLSEAHCRLLEIAKAAGYGDADNSAIIRAFDKDK